MRGRLAFSFFLVTLTGTACCLPLCAQDTAAHAHPAYAEPIRVPGVSNVGKVNEFLYRGSQPNLESLRELKKLGITTIVELRGKYLGHVERERKSVESVGLRFVDIPASGWSPPPDDQVVQFLSLMQQRPREKMYVHCWLGDDRTGVFIATYRIVYDHWTAQQAIDEMAHFHFNAFWHPSMKDYVRNFPAHFAESPAFAGLRDKVSSPKQ